MLDPTTLNRPTSGPPRTTERATSSRFAAAIVKRLDRAPALRSQDHRDILDALSRVPLLPDLDRRSA